MLNLKAGKNLTTLSTVNQNLQKYFSPMSGFVLIQSTEESTLHWSNHTRCYRKKQIYQGPMQG